MDNDQTPVTVREIQPSDHEQWLPLWQAYQVFYEVALDDEITRAAFHRFLDPNEPVFSAVAVQGQQLVGFVHSVLHRSTWSVTDSCYLEDLYVAPAVRGTGAGQQLIEWVQAFARQRQCALLYWHTHETNQRAQKLYDRVARKSGFIEYRMAL